MKIKQLQKVTGKKYTSKDKQMEIIQNIAEQENALNRVYGVVVIEQKEDELLFTYQNEHYGTVKESFQTLEELRSIQDNLCMSYFEAENIHWRRSFEATTVTELEIIDANAMVDFLASGEPEPYTAAYRKIKGSLSNDYWFMFNLVEIHAYVNKRSIEFAYAVQKAEVKPSFTKRA